MENKNTNPVRNFSNYMGEHKILKEVLSWGLYVIFLILAYLTFTHFVTTANVDGHSMDPNLHNGEKMLVLKQATVKRNSVIVFDANGEDPTANTTNYYVKRVIGIPGDKISYKDGKLYVNNKVSDQSYISKQELAVGTRYFDDNDKQIKNWDIASLSKTKWVYNQNQTVVPKGKYFVLGDNRSISNDSRYWGFVDKDKILGVVKLFPWSGTKTERHNINDLAK